MVEMCQIVMDGFRMPVEWGLSIVVLLSIVLSKVLSETVAAMELLIFLCIE